MCKNDNGYIYLQLSGGRDSLLLLQLLEEHPQRDQFTLCALVVDTGSWPDEYRKRMIEIAKRIEIAVIESDSKQYREIYGDPFDIQYFEKTAEGIRQTVSPLQCCHANIMKPMDDYLRKGPFRVVIRGTKRSEIKGVAKFQVGTSYSVANLLFDFTDDEVMRLLKDVPSNYKMGGCSGVDCIDCTAWEQHNNDNYIRVVSPEVYDKIRVKRSAHVKKVKALLGDYPQD